jgi:GTP-binding protein
MPQTRYVLMRALRLGLRPIVVVNKVDRPNARPADTLDKTFDLFIELGASDGQADFPVLYGSGLDGWIVSDLNTDKHEGMEALFETIVRHVPPPDAKLDAPFLMQIGALAWSDYVGQIGCGRVLRGRLRVGETFMRVVTRWKNPIDPRAGWELEKEEPEKAAYLWETRGLQRAEVEEIQAGDIVWIAGPSEIRIGDTFRAVESEGVVLPPLEIEEPTVSMFFLVNSGPFAGQDGKAATLRQVKSRLEKELRTNVAMRMEDIGRADGVKVSGRGELHLAILIEEMRREGFELCVSRPEVILRRDEKGRVLEPIERLIADVPEIYQGVVIEKLAKRKGEMKHMENNAAGMVRLEFDIPTRGLIGYRGDFLTDTRGLGIMASRFTGYEEWRGDVGSRNRGSLISMETGPATSYQLENLQQRATLFIDPMEPVYMGQIIGENSRPDDMPCNPTKRKALTNHRAATKDMMVTLKVPVKLNLDTALEWIGDDELVEVTPKSIRVRKATLCPDSRKKEQRRQETATGVSA